MTRAAGAEVLAGSLCILAWVEQNLSVAVWVAVWVSVLTRAGSRDGSKPDHVDVLAERRPEFGF